MICRIARHYGGWPHEVAHWRYRYYMAVRREYLDEMKATAKAAEPEPDENTIEM